MKNITVKDILINCNGELVCGNEDIVCTDFSTDTRTIKKGDTYVALKGENFDGNNFYKQAIENGAAVCVIQGIEVSDDIKENHKDVAIIKVADTLKALQQIAKYKRSLYDIPVVAVTGSVGKTSTKDIITSVLKRKYNVLSTEGNLNNHIGVPLTVLRLKNHDAMVVEMGMSHLNEISVLTDIAKPTIAVITNVGTAHIGNLGSRENILKAKLEILEGLSEDGTLVINNDNDMLHKWNIENSKYKVLDFGIKNKSNVMAENITINERSSEFTVRANNEDYKVTVKIAGEHYVYNSLCAICIGKLLDINMTDVISGIDSFVLSKNRMEVKHIKDITIINDCYNANFDSMKSSIESLTKLNSTRKIAVLGDMLELGEYSEKLHLDVGSEVYKNNIDILITVGNEAKYIAQSAKQNGMRREDVYEYENNEDAIEELKKILTVGDAVLIKASNGMHFTKIVKEIEECLEEK